MLKGRALCLGLRVVGGAFAAAPSIAQAQMVERRLSVSSIEVVRSENSAQSAPRADEKGVKKPTPLVELSVGARESLRVRFQLSPDIDIKELPKQPMRLGLFLERDLGAVASVQRGSLDNCTGRFCVATFAGNADMQFYNYEIKHPGKWFVQLLQNPILEERMLEAEIKKKKGPFDFDVINGGFFYGRQSISLDENSSTILNSAKSSRRGSYGSVIKISGIFDNWELTYNRFRAQLGTQGFFGQNFVTKVSDVDMSIAYNFVLSPHFGVGLGAGRNTFTFLTTNDDEALLSTDYAAWIADLRFQYFTPYEIVKFRGGREVFDWGRGQLVVAYGLLGGAKDLSEFKRGNEAKWKTLRITYEHAFELRSTFSWINRTQIGVGGQFVSNSDVFSGEVSSPFVGLPENSRSQGYQLSWKAFVGREFRFK